MSRKRSEELLHEMGAPPHINLELYDKKQVYSTSGLDNHQPFDHKKKSVKSKMKKPYVILGTSKRSGMSRSKSASRIDISKHANQPKMHKNQTFQNLKNSLRHPRLNPKDL